MQFIDDFFEHNPEKVAFAVANDFALMITPRRIPKLHYVCQAIAFTQSKEPQTMIIAELIDPFAQFYKYIHNSSAEPMVPATNDRGV